MLKYVSCPATLGDDLFLRQLFDDVRSSEFSPLGLPAAALISLLEMQFRAQRISYAAQFPNAADEILWVGPTRAGRVLIDEGKAGIQLIDIALLAPYRGQGIGTTVLRGLCQRARSANVPLRLSVRFGSPAERLYKRLGFVRTGGDGINVAMELSGLEPRIAETTPAHDPLLSGLNVEPALTEAYFGSLLGRTMNAKGPNETSVELLVKRVQPLQMPDFEANLERGDSFTVTFHGPMGPILPSACTELTPHEGNPLAVFLVPLGPKGGLMEYEAIFNRMAVRAT